MKIIFINMLVFAAE